METTNQNSEQSRRDLNQQREKNCQLTNQIKNLKRELQEIASQTSPLLSVSIRISISGMAVLYHVDIDNYQKGIKMEAIGNSIELLMQNFHNELSKYPTLLRANTLFKFNKSRWV